jgi:SAM-dependent methyltransferase
MIRKIYHSIRYGSKMVNAMRVDAVLTSKEPWSTERSESDFSKLQSDSIRRNSYAYDPFSLWNRANERVAKLLSLLPSLRARGLSTLDAGCGDGMLSVLLNAYGHHVTLVDMEDWRDAQARQLPFISSKLEDLVEITSNSQDLVTSFNTFEHVQDPTSALVELLRVVRPGGHIYLHFGPLYCSPIGLHAHKTLNMPFPQFLFREEFWRQKLREFGINDLGGERSDLQPLNKWRLHQFEELFHDCGGEAVLLKRFYSRDCTNLILKYPEAFRGRGLTYDDVTVQGLEVLLKKPETPNQSCSERQPCQ